MTNFPIATDKLVASLIAPATGQRFVWDGTVPGFGVRVTANGAKSFILDYRAKGGIQRRFTIGSSADWKVAAARRHASQLRKAIDLGADPVGEDKAAREAMKAEAARRKTIDQLADRFEAEHLPSLRPATRKFYRLALKNHIRPALGRMEVEEVQRDDVEALHATLTAKGQRHQANQCAILCGVLFRYAAKWGWRSGDNPAREVTRHTLEGRERYPQRAIRWRQFERHLEHGIGAQGIGVVAVLIARRDHQQPKANDVGEAMRDLIGALAGLRADTGSDFSATV